MNYLISFIFTVATITNLYFSGIVGKWSGNINAQGQRLSIELEVKDETGNLSSLINSPDQGVSGIPVASTILIEDTLKLDIRSIQATYEGIVKTDSIIGTWSQSGLRVPLNLKKLE